MKAKKTSPPGNQDQETRPTPARLEPHEYYKKFIIGLITTYNMKRHFVYDQDALIEDRIKELKEQPTHQGLEEDQLYMYARDELDLIIKRDVEEENGPFFMSKDDLIFFTQLIE